MAVVKIIAGGVAPECVRFLIDSGTSGIDMTTIGAAQFTLRPRSGGKSMTWAGTIESATAKLLTVRHDYAIDDTRTVGIYSVMAILTTRAGGTLRAVCDDAAITNP